MSPDPQVAIASLTPRWQPAVAVGLAAAAALALMLGTTGGSGWTGGPDGASPVVADPAPERAPAPAVTTTAGPTATPAPAAAPTPSTSPAAGLPPLAQARPQPFVQDFATGATTGQAPLPSPTAPVSMPAGLDGCDHGYGTVTQCVPWQFPPGVTDGCAWLLARDYGPLEVHGDDRHNLDRNEDGIACGPDD